VHIISSIVRYAVPVLTDYRKMDKVSKRRSCGHLALVSALVAETGTEILLNNCADLSGTEIQLNKCSDILGTEIQLNNCSDL